MFPIMLNKVFEKSGFGWGSRATGFLVLGEFLGDRCIVPLLNVENLGCLLMANLLMRTRLPPKSKAQSPPPDVKGIVTDVVFQLTVAG